ncbi:MAG: EthD domain-containing protein [Chloroflexi bacterium]|nr:EthD domain-containing protein [Chloroflexota bacterium]
MSDQRTRAVFLVLTNPKPPMTDAEFNRWYDTVHVPDVLKTPGFVAATRYQHADPKPGDARYLAVYELDTDDVAAAGKALGQVLKEARAQGRMADIQVVSAAYYKRLDT